MNDSDNESTLSEDSDVAFAFVDFTNVNFGSEEKEEEKSTTIDSQRKENNDRTEPIMNTKVSNVNDGESNEDDKVGEPEKQEISDDSTFLNQMLLDGTKALSLGNNRSSDKDKTTTVQKQNVDDKNVIKVDKVNAQPSELSEEDVLVLEIEKKLFVNDCTYPSTDKETDEHDLFTGSKVHDRIQTISNQLCNGDYIGVLHSPTLIDLFETDDEESASIKTNHDGSTVSQRIRDYVVKYCTTTAKCVEVEMVAIAAFNLFVQVNYTGPSLHHGGVARPGKEDEVKQLNDINPHGQFASQLHVSQKENDEKTINSESKEGDDTQNDVGGDDDNVDEPPVDLQFQNAVLAELSVEGEWPCPVCKYPYFLLLARSILLTLADPNRPDWSCSFTNEKDSMGGKGVIVIQKDSTHYSSPTELFVANTYHLATSQLWSARAAVAHARLLQADDPSALNLWNEVTEMFECCKQRYCTSEAFKTESDSQLATKVLLEYGLAEHHFDANKKGKLYFEECLKFANLDVQVTGAEGRRTKYQQKTTAQMLVRAKPTVKNDANSDNATKNEQIGKQFIDHQDETILLDKVKFVEEADNTHFELSILQQTVLLALCLDVKNKNPMDGLTAEEMGAFLERVLQQHDDWMVYATGLLERAWLESERNHTRERAILQLQALVDQHSNRLTLTQSTFQAAVEDSAPPQERLRHIHYIVYPPRWQSLRDLAERYAKMGIVTSAAEIFEEIELWDEVVDCYRRAGKENKAEEVVRKRLTIAETPRMWAALGDITKDISYYEKALELSKGKYAAAYVCLGKHYSDKGDFSTAAKNYLQAVRIKPLSPLVWFNLGAVSMRIEDWSTALKAYTEVVQQEPEEADAWANVAAIHMQNKEPQEAYPALNESLKLNRNNWRVWVSKLYTCMDLEKYDEAVQSCLTLIDMKSKRNDAEGIPDLEERVIRGIVGGVVATYHQAKKANDIIAIDSAKRSLTRVRELLSKLATTMKSEVWLFDTSAFFNESIGCDDLAIEDLMKEYRAIQCIRGWETDTNACPKLVEVVSQIAELKLREKDEVELKKFKFLVNGVIKKIKKAYFDQSKLPVTEMGKLDRITSKL